MLLMLTMLVNPFILKAQISDELNIHPDLIPLLDKNMAPFYHGVASGDPTENSVVLWTKVTLNKNISFIPIEWQIAEDPDFKKPIGKGITSTSNEQDFTVKIDITDLEENTKYYYRFMLPGDTSIVGQTLTLPKDPTEFTMAFASCSNYEWGYFNNYRFIAEDPEVDLVVHLGDYIYEYAPNVYGDTSIGRVNVPAREITTLDDYRTRHSLYALDRDLIKLHQMKPMITTWDDHEIANNGYVDGAQNHQTNEGNWQTRKNAGKQAYYEWLPIRDNSYHELYRSFKLGTLLELVILDTRIAGRTKQVDSESDAGYNDSARTILGKDQYSWLMNKLTDKTTRWKIIGNQVPFGPMYQPDMKGSSDKYMDGWDGYPFERKKLIKAIARLKIKNVVWLTGDYHCSFALENDIDGTVTTDDNVSVEFVVTSITSANDDEWLSLDSAKTGRQYYLDFNPHCKYVNNIDNGYVVVKVENTQITTHFYYAETVREPSQIKRKEKTFIVMDGKPVLIPQD